MRAKGFWQNLIQIALMCSRVVCLDLQLLAIHCLPDPSIVCPG